MSAQNTNKFYKMEISSLKLSIFWRKFVWRQLPSGQCHKLLPAVQSPQQYCHLLSLLRLLSLLQSGSIDQHTYLQRRSERHGLKVQNIDISLWQRHRQRSLSLGQGHVGNTTCWTDHNLYHCNTCNAFWDSFITYYSIDNCYLNPN